LRWRGSAYPTFTVTGLRCGVSGVMRIAVMRLRLRRSTRKRKPWKVKLCPAAAHASYLPARRASAIDPVETLKAE
jgi:hypothetical protein